MPFFFLKSCGLVKLMYALILFVHNSSWKIITSLFCSNYIKNIKQVLKNPTTFLSMSFKIYCHMHATIDKCILSLTQSLPRLISSHLVIFVIYVQINFDVYHEMDEDIFHLTSFVCPFWVATYINILNVCLDGQSTK